MKLSRVERPRVDQCSGMSRFTLVGSTKLQGPKVELVAPNSRATTNVVVFLFGSLTGSAELQGPTIACIALGVRATAPLGRVARPASAELRDPKVECTALGARVRVLLCNVASTGPAELRGPTTVLRGFHGLRSHELTVDLSGLHGLRAREFFAMHCAGRFLQSSHELRGHELASIDLAAFTG